MTTTQTTAQTQQNTLAQVNVSEAMRKLGAIRRELNEVFIERTQEIDALLIAVLSGHNLVLLGAPGEAKSALLSALTARIIDAQLFETMLMKATVPDELFGGPDMDALRNRNIMQHDTTMMLPDHRPAASIALLDEVFKASAALQNSLLSIMNEHRFRNGRTVVDVPLLTLVGASNEYPQDPELAALWDRFLLRVWVRALSDAGHRQFMAAETLRRKERAAALLAGQVPPHIGHNGTKLSVAEIRALQALTLNVDIPQSTLEMWYKLRDKLAIKHGHASTRRSGWFLGLLSANAVLNGRTTAAADDLIILQHALWNDQGQMREIAQTVMSVAAPLLQAATEAYDAMLSEIDACLVLAGKGETPDAQRVAQLMKAKQAATRTGKQIEGLILQARGEGRDTALLEIMVQDTRAKYQKAVAMTNESMGADWGE